MGDSTQQRAPVEQIARGHETRDANPRVIALLLLGLFIVIGGIFLLLGGMYAYLAARRAQVGRPASPLAVVRQLPPGPRLEVNPAQDLEKMRAHEDEVLRSYGWVDRQAGIVRIPIDRAIDLLLQKGLPTRATENRDSKRDDGGR